MASITTTMLNVTPSRILLTCRRGRGAGRAARQRIALSMARAAPKHRHSCPCTALQAPGICTNPGAATKKASHACPAAPLLTLYSTTQTKRCQQQLANKQSRLVVYSLTHVVQHHADKEVERDAEEVDDGAAHLFWDVGTAAVLR